MSTATLPREVEVRLQRRDAAIRWRGDHAHHPDRDRLWRSYVTGALWQKRRPERPAIVAGLADAERAIPFSAHDLDADPDPERLPSVGAVEAHEVELVDRVDRGLHAPHLPRRGNPDRGLVGTGDERLRDAVDQFPVGHRNPTP